MLREILISIADVYYDLAAWITCTRGRPKQSDPLSPPVYPASRSGLVAQQIYAAR